MKTNQLKYTVEQIAEFGEYYNNGHSLKETSEHFNINYGTLKQNLIRFGYRKPSKVLKNQRVSPNTYFDIINSHNKAYFLGYLYADGYIASTPYGKNIGIGLQLQDKYILDVLKSEMNLLNKIGIYQNSCKLQFTDQHTYDNLQKLGICEDKSHSDFHVPNINSEFLSSFIRGYFDGDGCITIKSTGYSVTSICCNSKIFLNDIKSILELNEIECRPITTEKRKYNDLYVLYISKRESQLKFMSFIYKDANVFLKRKYDKFLQIPRKTT